MVKRGGEHAVCGAGHLSRAKMEDPEPRGDDLQGYQASEIDDDGLLQAAIRGATL